eukprot:EG_transcript_45466
MALRASQTLLLAVVAVLLAATPPQAGVLLRSPGTDATKPVVVSHTATAPPPLRSPRAAPPRPATNPWREGAAYQLSEAPPGQSWREVHAVGPVLGAVAMGVILWVATAWRKRRASVVGKELHISLLATAGRSFGKPANTA